MKYVLGLSLCLLTLSIHAQSKHRFREKGVQIIESNIKTGQHYDPGGQWFVLYRFGGDTILNGQYYQIVDRKSHSSYDFKSGKLKYSDTDFQIFGLIRVDSTKKVFFRPLQALAADNYFDLRENQDKLIYDFGVNVQDTVAWKTGLGKVVASIDSIRLETEIFKKRIVFSRLPGWEYDNDIWIEGIGSSKGLLGSLFLRKSPPGPFVNVTCVFDSLELLEYDYWASEAVSSIDPFLDCRQDLYAPPQEEYKVSERLELYPSPTYFNYVTLKSSLLLSEIKSVKLYNDLGQLMAQLPIKSKHETYFFSDVWVPDVPSVYFVVVETVSGEKLAKRIIKL